MFHLHLIILDMENSPHLLHTTLCRTAQLQFVRVFCLTSNHTQSYTTASILHSQHKTSVLPVLQPFETILTARSSRSQPARRHQPTTRTGSTSQSIKNREGRQNGVSSRGFRQHNFWHEESSQEESIRYVALRAHPEGMPC